jgi:hypothetical protein
MDLIELNPILNDRLTDDIRRKFFLVEMDVPAE